MSSGSCAGSLLLRLVFVEHAQVLVILQQGLKGCRQLLLLLVLGHLLVLEQCILCGEQGALAAQ